MLLFNIYVLKINELYQYAGNSEYQQQFKDIIEADMVSTPEVLTNNSHISPITPKSSQEKKC